MSDKEPFLRDPSACDHVRRMATAAQHVPHGELGHAFVVCVDCGMEARSFPAEDEQPVKEFEAEPVRVAEQRIVLSAIKTLQSRGPAGVAQEGDLLELLADDMAGYRVKQVLETLSHRNLIYAKGGKMTWALLQ